MVCTYVGMNVCMSVYTNATYVYRHLNVHQCWILGFPPLSVSNFPLLGRFARLPTCFFPKDSPASGTCVPSVADLKLLAFAYWCEMVFCSNTPTPLSEAQCFHFALPAGIGFELGTWANTETPCTSAKADGLKENLKILLRISATPIPNSAKQTIWNHCHWKSCTRATSDQIGISDLGPNLALWSPLCKLLSSARLHQLCSTSKHLKAQNSNSSDSKLLQVPLRQRQSQRLQRPRVSDVWDLPNIFLN